MNISFVSDAIYPYNRGGKEKRLFEISTRLAKAGHDVHIYTMHWWDAPSKTVTENGVVLHAICPLVPMYIGDRRSIKEALVFSLACFKLWGVKFEILDVDHMPFFPLYSSWLVCLLRRKRLYATWHEALSRQEWTTYMGAAGNIAAVVERLSVHLPHTITAASDHTRLLIAKHLHRTKRIKVAASGIDTALIASVEPAAINCDVFYVGRLVKDKNVDLLIQAMAIVTKTKPTARCIIVGHGVEQANLAARITELELQSQVSLLPPLPEASDVYGYMKAAKVYCLPSVREGFGIVALEALGCGTPVITIDTPTNAAKDLITDGVNGSIVPLNAEALATSILHWITIAKPADIANKVADYDWNAIAKVQEGVYLA